MIILEREGPVGDSSGERQGLKGEHEGVNSPTGVSRSGFEPVLHRWVSDNFAIRLVRNCFRVTPVAP